MAEAPCSWFVGLLLGGWLCTSFEAQAQAPLVSPLQPASNPTVSRSPQDPSQLTTEALRREIELLGALIAVELEAIKKAQAEFQSNITRVPTDVDKQVGQLDAVVKERLATVTEKFKGLEGQLGALKDAIATSDINRAENIGIALTAQQASVEKAALGTAEQLNNINQIQRAREESLLNSITSLSGGINDLKDRIITIEQRSAGAIEQRSTSQESVGQWIGWIFAALGIMSGIGIAVFKSQQPAPAPAPAPAPTVVYVQPQPAPRGAPTPEHA